jgi:hypothetical protein
MNIFEFVLITVCDCVRCAECGVLLSGCPAFEFMQCAAVCYSPAVCMFSNKFEIYLYEFV